MPAVLAAVGLSGFAIRSTLAATRAADQGVAGSCAACHGSAGQGSPALDAPRLAGLPRNYLLRQMQAFAGGQRRSAIMAPIARALSAGELARLASLYARSRAAPTVTSAAGTAASAGAANDLQLLARGARLARLGRWQQQLPACTQCHGARGSGVGESFPPLAGQSAAYLRAQLQAWQSGARDPGPLGLMGAIAHRLSALDISAVAVYFASGQPAVLPAPAQSQPPEQPQPPEQSQPPAQSAAAAVAAPFSPPPDSLIPHDAFGRVVRFGEQIFDDPSAYAAGFVGNRLRCSSCHLDRGRRAGSAPMWAAYVAYPAYRAKNGHVNTFAERLQGCFRYSMNGQAPPLGSPVLVALESYAYWLASGARVTAHLPGRGYPRVPPPARPADFRRGARVYAEHCALCHGKDGAGQNAREGTLAFPALWGDGSFNWGAGMADVDNAAGFIRANMPLSQDHTLSPQQTWDVALFMDSHERPQDPRFQGSVQATRRRFHDGADSMYGRRVNGHILGEGSTAAGGALQRVAR